MNVLRELKAGDLLMSFNSNVTMLVITFPFFFLYLFYFLISLNYVYKNLINKTRKIMINWIDYLPIQKLPKILSRISSTSIRPVILPIFLAASLISSAANSIDLFKLKSYTSITLSSLSFL